MLYRLVINPICWSVCLESVLWQNSRLVLDAVSGGEWGRSRDGCIRLGGDRQRGRGSFGGKCRASIVTDDIF